MVQLCNHHTQEDEAGTHKFEEFFCLFWSQIEIVCLGLWGTALFTRIGTLQNFQNV